MKTVDKYQLAVYLDCTWLRWDNNSVIVVDEKQCGDALIALEADECVAVTFGGELTGTYLVKIGDTIQEVEEGDIC